MNEKIWAYLIHLGLNNWMEKDETAGAYEGAETIKSHFAHGGENCSFRCASDKLRCNKKYFRALVDRAHQTGVNMIVIDLAEVVKYETHPELAVADAWSVAELAEEIAYIKSLGMDAVPSMDFSAAHDEWLGEYARMVSTPTYYRVVAELIKEVCTIFGSPKLFYIGMGDEDSATQSNYGISIVRHGDLWWHDLNYIVKQVEANGARAWCNTDRILKDGNYAARMSKEIVQGHYFRYMTDDLEACRAKMETDPRYKERYEKLSVFAKLNDAGFEMLPIGTNYNYDDQFRHVIIAAKRYTSDDKVLGFMMTTYAPTLPSLDVLFDEAMVDIDRAMQTYAGAELSTKRRMLYGG